MVVDLWMSEQPRLAMVGLLNTMVNKVQQVTAPNAKIKIILLPKVYQGNLLAIGISSRDLRIHPI